MKKLILILILITAIVGCVNSSQKKDYSAEMLKLFKADFKSKGPVKVDQVLQQDDAQKFCTEQEGKQADIYELAKIQAVQLKKIKYPANGEYLGDWKIGNKIANSGIGGQFSDPVGTVSGGNCFGCHQITKDEIAYGTLGPSLYQYGKIRGSSSEVYKYTWAKIYNAQAFVACSSMPRFGHSGILDEQQIKDVMALLLAIDSPVNR